MAGAASHERGQHHRNRQVDSRKAEDKQNGSEVEHAGMHAFTVSMFLGLPKAGFIALSARWIGENARLSQRCGCF